MIGAIQRRTAMKTTVLAAALLAAFSMPAFADDAVKTDDAKSMTLVDPVTTSATPTSQSDMPKTAIKKHGCMHRNTAFQMM
jgi:hypothetical protein